MIEVWERFGPVIVAAVAIIPVAVALAVVLTRHRVARGIPLGEARRRSRAELAIVAGTWPWLWMILMPTDGERAVRLVPLVDLTDVLISAPSVVVVQVVGNLLVFAAWGWCGPIRFRIGPAEVGGVALIASVTVEALQYGLSLGRVSSVDDVLINVLGAVLAASVSVRLNRERRDAVPV